MDSSFALGSFEYSVSFCAALKLDDAVTFVSGTSGNKITNLDAKGNYWIANEFPRKAGHLFKILPLGLR